MPWLLEMVHAAGFTMAGPIAGAAIRIVTDALPWSMLTSCFVSVVRSTIASSVPLPFSSMWLQIKKQGITPTLCVIVTSTG